METHEDTSRPKKDERPDRTKLRPDHSHLQMRDTRTPEERLAASLKESAKRSGRGGSKWWEKSAECSDASAYQPVTH